MQLVPRALRSGAGKYFLLVILLLVTSCLDLLGLSSMLAILGTDSQDVFPISHIRPEEAVFLLGLFLFLRIIFSYLTNLYLVHVAYDLRAQMRGELLGRILGTPMNQFLGLTESYLIYSVNDVTNRFIQYY